MRIILPEEQGWIRRRGDPGVRAATEEKKFGMKCLVLLLLGN